MWKWFRSPACALRVIFLSRIWMGNESHRPCCQAGDSQYRFSEQRTTGSVIWQQRSSRTSLRNLEILSKESIISIAYRTAKTVALKVSSHALAANNGNYWQYLILPTTMLAVSTAAGLATRDARRQTTTSRSPCSPKELFRPDLPVCPPLNRLCRLSFFFTSCFMALDSEFFLGKGYYHTFTLFYWNQARGRAPPPVFSSSHPS